MTIDQQAESLVDKIFNPPSLPWHRRAWSYVTWGLRHPYWAICFNLARLPRVKKYVRDSTSLNDYGLPYEALRRACWKEWAAAGLIVEDHPAGCFYGSFIGAYPDNWHIPYDAECELPHGSNPIKLEAPGGTDA